MDTQWIDAKKELPPRSKDCEWVSDYVLVCVFIGRGIGYYDFDEKHWVYSLCGKTEMNDNKVKYWAPYPDTPFKFEKDCFSLLKEVLDVWDNTNGIQTMPMLGIMDRVRDFIKNNENNITRAQN